MKKNYQPLEHKNPYTKEIISKWQSNASIYKIRYFLMISTINKTLMGLMESFKDKATKENKKDKSENNLINKINMPDETYNNMLYFEKFKIFFS